MSHRIAMGHAAASKSDGSHTDAACTFVLITVMVGRPGLEPGTHGLKVRCSTIELTPLGFRRCGSRVRKRTESAGRLAPAEPMLSGRVRRAFGVVITAR